MELLNERQAAYLLSLSVYTLQRDRRIGSKIPFLKLGRAIRYRRQDIEAYLQKNSYTSTSQYNKGGQDA